MPTTTRPGTSDDVRPGVAMDRVPLIELLARVKNAYVAEFDRRLLDSEFCALSLAHSRNVLRHLGNGPQRAGRLVEVAGVTKQAISQQLVHLERNGYVRIDPDPEDQRARLVVLTAKGRRAQELVRRTFVEIERDWGAHLGSDDGLALLRRHLDELVRSTGSCDDPDAATGC